MRPRRWMRLSVRGLMLVVLALAVVFGWIAREARLQKEAVAAIDRAGGWVEYDRLGVVTSVFFQREDQGAQGRTPRPPAAPMEQIGRLRWVKTLHLDGNPGVTDEGLAHLRGLAHLKRLNIYDARISGRGLAHLAILRDLKELSLSGCKLRDEDLAPLAKCRSLVYLDLGCTGIGDEGLKHVRGLTGLQGLTLVWDPVTADGLSYLRELNQLTALDIMCTKVGSIGPLKGMTNLEMLWLYGCPIEESGLAELPTLTGLNRLVLPEGEADARQ